MPPVEVKVFPERDRGRLTFDRFSPKALTAGDVTEPLPEFPFASLVRSKVRSALPESCPFKSAIPLVRAARSRPWPRRAMSAFTAGLVCTVPDAVRGAPPTSALKLLSFRFCAVPETSAIRLVRVSPLAVRLFALAFSAIFSSFARSPPRAVVTSMSLTVSMFMA